MQVYRLVKSTYANDLSGTGAAMAGGRWNNKGRAVLYTSENTALALLEIVVNIPPMFRPDLHLLKLDVPKEKIIQFDSKQLPDNWFKYPAPRILAEMAEKHYLDPEILGIQVPSAIVHDQFNFILNPISSHFKEVKLLSKQPFIFDPRLYRKV
jgi:RES domain-containing protein